jgi:predicted permease
LIDGLLLRPLPVPHGEELAVLHFDRSDSDSANYYFCAPLIRALENRRDVFQSLAAFSSTTLQVRAGSGTEEVSGALVSGRFFDVLETPPLLGRYLTAQDDRTGNPGGYAVVISEAFWRKWFNSAPDVVGRRLIIANAPFVIAGVMPRQFIGADPTKRPGIFVPLSAEPVIDAPYNNIADGYRSWWLQMIARRNSGVSLQQANAALEASTNAILDESVPDASWLKDARSNHFRVGAEAGSRGFNFLGLSFRKPLVVVFALCGAILLLACLNLASLLMARAAAREREMATRLAIGATRGCLIRQLLAESLLIASLGTTVGLALTPIVSRGLAALLIGTSRNTVLDTTPDPLVFGFAATITLIATLLIGLLPALRSTSGDLNDHIKNASHTRSARDRRRWLPCVLMGTEVALALLLVVGAVLLATSLTRLYRTGLGFQPKGLVNLDLAMNKQALEGDALLHWYQAFADALSHQPGVKGVSFENITPLSGSWMRSTYHTPISNGNQSVYGNTVGPDYFATMQIPLLAGRDFNWIDTRTGGSRIILNQSAAKILFPGRSAVGQSVLSSNGKAFEVIAVVGDVHYTSIRENAPPTVYRSITQSSDNKASYTAVVRISGPAAPLAGAVRALIAHMAPDVPLPVLTTMSSQIDDSISSERMMAMLSVFFAVCALLVTAIGLYGTLAYATARRTSEIGVRMALGAQRSHVVAMVFRENAWVAAVGSIAGLAAALLASRALASFLYGTSVHDPWVLVGSVAALILIASAASLLPALRAARIEPMAALRTE